MSDILNRTTGFDLRDHRAMVSLGPLTNRKHCTYSCPFCYVNSHFASYPKLSQSDIISWLRSLPTESYDVIYVSGDTDSFAPPRTQAGLNLLFELTKLNKDILFTTRMVFSKEQTRQLKSLAMECKKRRILLFGCVSIAQLHHPHLEPHPIAIPVKRANQLKVFKELGIISILAMRPFLPIVTPSEHKEILELCKDSIDIVLGESWYMDEEGELEKKVLKSNSRVTKYTHEQMPFDNNNASWRVYHGLQSQEVCKQWSDTTGIPFFMRSRPAIEWARRSRIY